MGLGPFSRCSSCDSISEARVTSDQSTYGNPDPNRFNIEKIKSIGQFTIVKIHYPNATNYEGRKILVYRGIKADTIKKATVLDPHFCDKVHFSPVARFEPTTRGWRYAISFCRSFKNRPTN